MKPRAYLETSLISYLVGRLSRDVIVLGNQELTREWWLNRRTSYELFVSEIVIREAILGDPRVAEQRMDVVAGLPILAVTEEAEQLAPLLLRSAGLSRNAETDALHVAGCDRPRNGVLVDVELHSYRERFTAARR